MDLKIRQYTISSDFFEKGFKGENGPCRCTSTCCAGGVYTDILERDKILVHKERIKQHMDETQSKSESEWFDTAEENDEDFPSGKCVGTAVINDKCAFLDKHGRCSLQVAASEQGNHRWALKPVFCILFPIEISNNRVGFDDMLQGDEQCCTVGNEFDLPLFRACKDEFIHLVGEDGYQLMEEHYAKSAPDQTISRT